MITWLLPVAVAAGVAEGAAAERGVLELEPEFRLVPEQLTPLPLEPVGRLVCLAHLRPAEPVEIHQ